MVDYRTLIHPRLEKTWHLKGYRTAALDEGSIAPYLMTMFLQTFRSTSGEAHADLASPTREFASPTAERAEDAALSILAHLALACNRDAEREIACGGNLLSKPMTHPPHGKAVASLSTPLKADCTIGLAFLRRHLQEQPLV